MIQDLIIKMVLRQAMSEIIKRVSFLGWGPFPAILSIILEKVITVLVEKTVLGLNFLYIDIKTEQQLREYQKSMAEIEELLMKGDYDAQAMDDLVKDAAVKFYRIG